ncbi:MAG: nuclear transport factor 2 family protein [Gemmatimonadales bacterium]|nr:nuclear transport factor 2 family protein [Gemmatimonadales bacterium]
MTLHIRSFRAVLLAGLAVVPVQQASSPTAAVQELLSADRSFAAASAKTDLITGLSAMLADDAMMGLPGGKFADGRAAVVEGLKLNALNVKSRAEWTPIRGGISADALHGFTFGYMTVIREDGTRVPFKYLSYWMKGPAGWRVAVYRRGLRKEGTPDLTEMPPSLPAALAPESKDAAAITGYRESLALTEKAFSDEAQRIGLGPAFAKYGSPDAANMGGPDDATFLIGAEAVAGGVGGGGPSTGSPVNWSSDKVIVASSGDFGVSIGMIRQNKPEAGRASAFPFFTIWRRASPNAPWRYIAE